MTSPIFERGGNLPAPSNHSAVGPVFSPGAAPGAARMSPVTRFIAALKRFKWLVLAMIAVGLVGGILATRMLPPKYAVSSPLALENRANNDAGPIEGNEIFTSGQWVELLSMPTVMNPVVRDRQLYLTGPNPSRLDEAALEGPSGPDAYLLRNFNWTERTAPGTYVIEFSSDGKRYTLTKPSSADNSTREMGAVGDSVGRRFGFEWVPNPNRRAFGQSYRFSVLTLDEVGNELKTRVKSDMRGIRAAFLWLSLDGRDPEKTAGTLNAVANQFVKEAAILKKKQISEQSAVLDTQLIAARKRLHAADIALSTFRVNNITKPKDDVPVTAGLQQTQPTVITNYFLQRTVADSLKRDRAELQRVVGRATRGELAVDQLVGIGAVQRSPNLSSVISQLQTLEQTRRSLLIPAPGQLARTDSHPEVIELNRQINELRTTTLPAYAGAVLRRLDEDLADIEGRIRTATSELRDIPTRSMQEDNLRREFKIAESQYNDLTMRYENSRLQEASSLADVRIINRAVPPVRPTKNRKPIIIALGVLIGLGLGIALAFVLDLTDKRFRYMDQVSSGLGLTILGVIPEIRRAKGQAASSEEAAQVIESFRTVRLNLLHMVPDATSIALTVTSPMPGDGKSLISSNLAFSFAEAGYRTLLVDGDTRRGELHRTLGVERIPGLLDHLADGAVVDTILRPTSHPHLTLMPGGSRHRNAPELMGSERMRKLIAAMRSRFDVIIVDSPPLGAGIDPFVLGTVTGQLMLVVRAGETDRMFAEAKLQVVDQLPIRLVGAVLNDVQTSLDEYKYYSYSEGYGAVDEIELTGGKKMIPTRAGEETATEEVER
ncbi:MAG: polysaccharide biosynthesis tyrosine autokinase [Gemmatimonadales bacterium]|nr:polysaccharide biosynthesis tyrosine autokinase [Gemmatimonadales bacterium]